MHFISFDLNTRFYYYEDAVPFSRNWIICSAAFSLSDWMLSIWESGTEGKSGLHEGGDEAAGRCFNAVIPCGNMSSTALVFAQDAFRLRHIGLNLK